MTENYDQTIEEKAYCSQCGSEINPSKKFCAECGASIEKDVCCVNCGEKLKGTEKFCPECGSSSPFKKEAKAPKGSSIKALSIVKASIMLFMAVLMLISVFIPIFSYKSNFPYLLGGFDEPVDINYSIFDGIIIATSSCLPNEGDLYERKSEELSSQFSENFSSWQDGLKSNAYRKYIKQQDFFSYRGNFMLVYWIVGLFCLAYIAVSITFVVYASLAFAGVFKQGKKDYLTASKKFLVLLAPMLASAMVLFKYILHPYETSLSTISILILFLSILAIGFFAVLRLFIENKTKAKASSIVLYSVSLTFAILLLVSPFMPVVSTRLKAPFSNSENATHQTAIKKEDADIMFSFYLTSEEIKNLSQLSQEEITDDINEYYANIQKEDKSSYLAYDSTEMYDKLFLSYGVYSISSVFSFGTGAIALVVLCACAMIWQILYEIVLGKKGNTIIKTTSKVFAILMSVLILAIIVFSIFIVNANAESLDFKYKATICSGTIFMLIFAIVCTSVPSVKFKAKQI